MDILVILLILLFIGGGGYYYGPWRGGPSTPPGDMNTQVSRATPDLVRLLVIVLVVILVIGLIGYPLGFYRHPIY